MSLARPNAGASYWPAPVRPLGPQARVQGCRAGSSWDSSSCSARSPASTVEACDRCGAGLRRRRHLHLHDSGLRRHGRHLLHGGGQHPSVVCYGVSGVGGTTAYPASITLNTGSLPPGTVEATSTTSSPACTTSTSGSGTTEHYILTCPITDTPTPAQTGTYPVTFTANPGTDGGAAVTSGT